MGVMNVQSNCIIDFSKIAKHLTDMMFEYFKGKIKGWSESWEKASEILKQRYTTFLVLYYYDLKLPLIVEIDASDFAISTIFYKKKNLNH
jgi:hypothetical protein